jgi:hypothetical protein
VADDELERRVAGLEHEHRLTRWYIGRVDRDLGEIGGTQAEHTERLERVETKLVEHTGRFDSIDAQLRSLTQMVGQALKRLPEPDH